MSNSASAPNPEEPKRITKDMSFRERVYHVIDNEEIQTPASHAFELFITTLILLSIAAIVMESFHDLKTNYEFYFNLFENTTLAIFIGEYLLRLFTADFKYKDAPNYLVAAWRFVSSGSGILDLIAVSPVVLVWSDMDFRFLRALKISRLMRVFKLSSLTRSVVMVIEVFIEKKSELGMTLFVTFVLLLVSATLMWYIEGGKDSEFFPNIIATFWWAIATLTTVGYGDIYPLTGWGRFLSGIIAVLGIGIVALPAGILSSAFIEKLEEEKEKELERKRAKRAAESGVTVATAHGDTCIEQFGQPFIYCPYCGGKLDEGDNHEH